MTSKSTQPEKPTPVEKLRQERALMAIPRNLTDKPKARPVKTSLPPSYAIIFDECVEFAYGKRTAGPDSPRLIDRPTEYALVQRAVKEYMHAIVLYARQNGVNIGGEDERANNYDP